MHISKTITDVVELSKLKALDADSRAIQQIVFQGVAGGADGTKIYHQTLSSKNQKKQS